MSDLEAVAQHQDGSHSLYLRCRNCKKPPNDVLAFGCIWTLGSASERLNEVDLMYWGKEYDIRPIDILISPGL